MNYKHSKQRQAVLDAVLSADRHVSADEVFAMLKERDSEIGIATVYRNLNLLTEWGALSRIKDPEKGYIYENAENKHYHFHCMECNKIEDVPVEYAEELDELISEKMGVTVKGHTMVFEGVCAECRQKEEVKA